MIAFLAAIGISAWVYSKTMRRTGDNARNSIMVTVIIFAISYVLTLTVLALVDKQIAG